MSNSNPPDPNRNHPDKIASNNKVIVLSMKNMSSFRFDPSKNFLGNNNPDNGQSVFSFKPQQLIQPQISTVQQQPKVQAPIAVQKIGTPGTILIRAQSTPCAVKPQLSVLSTGSNVKTQESPVKIQASVNKDSFSSTNPPTLTTFRSKSTSEITMKTQTGHTLLLQPTSVVKNPTIISAPTQISSGMIGINHTLATAAPASALPQFHITTVPKLASISKNVQYTSNFAIKAPSTSKLVPILPKVDSEKSNLIKQQIIASNRARIAQAGAQTYVAKINSSPQKWTVPGRTSAPLPALTLIQPKPIKINVPQETSRSQEELVTEEEAKEDEPEDIKEVEEEKTHEKKKMSSQEELFMQVKRIIEGDQDDFVQDASSQKLTFSNSEPDNEEEEETEEEEQKEVIEDVTQEQLRTSQESNPSTSMLLCDERIESASTEVSPNEGENSYGITTTPTSENIKSAEKNSSVQNVKKNLSLELSLECDKENVDVVMDESVSDDDSLLTESQRQLLQDYEESLMKTEISKETLSTPIVTIAQGKPKRVRKPKHPTIISTLGLPYKPHQPISRKTKVEKKLEFELDFHDPLNKIQWDDGIGGLNNCNKLFGFDEFGLIEVLSKRDATAKLKQLEVKEASNVKEEGSSYKLRKISDPVDHFVCVVCAKIGTIRDFYSPEACSESCLAITKRKTSECNTPVGKESSSESGLTTPVDERKLMFGGEMVPLQQLQQHLLEQQLPTTKLKSHKRPAVIGTVETKFQWDSYLTEKSVPAPLELFKNPYPLIANPFKVGMKLEAIDPANQKLFCICTVEEKLGYRIKLHFDGFPIAYDFWVNADSRNIFPSGFCHSTNRVLQMPPKWVNKKFDWSEYLDYTNSIGAPRALFPHMKGNEFEENPFKVGMKLETTRDGKMYAASIIDVLHNRVLISPDGHEELGCVWLDIDSPYLHPINHHNTIADPECFIPPSRPFSWVEYLKATVSKAAPLTFFYDTRKPLDFEPGLKLEVVDCVNHQLVRPATVLRRNEYKIQIIFDGFDINFAYWLDDDSEDIHPINWCEKTSHPIEHPAGFNKSVDNGLCPSTGCRGIGNGSFVDRFFHDNIQECPYNPINWKRLLSKNLESHIDAKPAVKRNTKQSKPSVAKETTRNGSRRNSCTRVKADPKEDSKDDDISIDLEDDFVDDDVIELESKRSKRKRAVPTLTVDEEDLEEPKKKIKISKAFLEDYGPQLNYSYNLWKKNSKVLDRVSIENVSTVNPIEWSPKNVSTFVKSITGDEILASKFLEQEIDGAAFICITKDDLVELMGTKLGVAIKIYNRILHLREEVMLNFMKI